MHLVKLFKFIYVSIDDRILTWRTKSRQAIGRRSDDNREWLLKYLCFNISCNNFHLEIPLHRIHTGLWTLTSQAAMSWII